MSGYRGFRSVTVSMASGASTTGTIQVSDPRDQVYVLVPSFSTNAAISVFGSADGTTFARVMQAPVNSSTTQVNQFRIASGTTGWVPVPADFPFIQLAATDTVANGASFTVIFKG